MLHTYNSHTSLDTLFLKYQLLSDSSTRAFWSENSNTFPTHFKDGRINSVSLSRHGCSPWCSSGMIWTHSWFFQKVLLSKIVFCIHTHTPFQIPQVLAFCVKWGVLKNLNRGSFNHGIPFPAGFKVLSSGTILSHLLFDWTRKKERRLLQQTEMEKYWERGTKLHIATGQRRDKS